MLDRLIEALARSGNEAADDVLLQALRLGAAPEQQVALRVLFRRKTSHGLRGIVAQYESLGDPLQREVLENLRTLHHALAECGRSKDTALRLAAMKIIAVGRQGKLAYVFSENLHEPGDVLSKAAAHGLVAMAKWVAAETRRLQKRPAFKLTSDQAVDPDREAAARVRYEQLMSERDEIETAVARATNLHRGKHGQELLRAALLLADWPGSKTLAILHTSKHGGQSAMVRRLQQPPDAEHVEAFLLGATHGRLRSHFGLAFSRMEEAPILDAVLAKTHWVKDQQLQLCLHQVGRGAWWGTTELSRDIDRRAVGEVAKIGEWLAVSGLHDLEQDERLILLAERARSEPDAASAESVCARLRLLRIAMRRRAGASIKLIKAMLEDPDERIVRIAAREMLRRKPAEYESALLKLMASATPSVRRVIGRSLGQAGFEQFWQRFEKLDQATRRSAGKAMFKLLPDALQRLERRALSGPMEQRVKAMQIAQELGLAESLRDALVQLCADPNPRVRSKAVAVAADAPSVPNEVLVERLLNDTDPRVRANAIEVLEGRGDARLVPILAERAQAATGRERANAVRAMHRMKVGTAGNQLMAMLRDQRAEHRISALWALRQIGLWQLVNEVANLARVDDNARVRRYALGVLKTVSDLVRDQKKAAG